MILKLDLHTHPLEAMRLTQPTLEGVARIVERVKETGLDGIGITEHWNRDVAFQVREMVEKHFQNAILVLPGWEIDVYPYEVVELFLPNNTVFRFLAHPPQMNSAPDFVDQLHGIEIENGGHNWHISKPQVQELATKYDLMLMRNSDAHYLEKIATHYNEIDYAEMVGRARGHLRSLAKSAER